MREIKFRAWDGNRFIKYEELKNYPFKNIIDKLGYTMEQYTGLKDKNGKDIYEHDYCKNPDGTIIFIVWKDFGFKAISIEIVDGKKLRIPLGNLGNYLISNCEIIGNIHEQA